MLESKGNTPFSLTSISNEISMYITGTGNLGFPICYREGQLDFSKKSEKIPSFSFFAKWTEVRR